ncbi:MAG TPA: hypothetical protein PLF42_03360 [Anaerolineales bacterium]|nr:hypothetical protein [Anaerolineales bacterium]
MLKTTFRYLLYLILLAPLLLFIAYGFSTRWFFPAPFPTEWTTSTFDRALNDSRTLTGLRDGLTIAFRCFRCYLLSLPPA